MTPAIGSENYLKTTDINPEFLLLVDGMHDHEVSRDIVRAVPPLNDALHEIDEALLTRFEEHDRLANESQRRFRFVIFVAAWGGTLVVLGALAQLAYVALDLHTAAHRAEKFSALLIILTAIGVFAGLKIAQIENWLIDRFKAEQIRLLKFRMLLDPRIWGSAEKRDAWRRELHTQRDQILRVNQGTLSGESERDEVPALPTREACSDITRDQLVALVDYYRSARIEPLLQYFTVAARRNPASVDQSRLLPLVFSISIILAGIHVAIEQALQRLPQFFVTTEYAWEAVSIALVATAAALPILWAGMRIWRSTRESTRNVTRYAARKHMLENELPKLNSLHGSDAEHVLSQLQTIELVLESDQRAWLRLMREVEWYG